MFDEDTADFGADGEFLSFDEVVGAEFEIDLS